MRCAALLIAVSLSLLAGCSSDAPELVQIQGSVSRNGKPVPNLILQFHPQEGRFSWGKSNAEGKFTLNYSKNYEGARVGKHRVFVVFDNSPETPYDVSGKQQLNDDQQEVIKKYGKLESTPLEVDLQANGQVVEIKLD
jgi:hypothetical protein